MSMNLLNAQITVCGGTENMSSAPLQLDGNDARWGVSLGTGLKLRDSLWDGLTDSHINTPMGITAENLADKYNISRQECDEFAVRSQQLWAAATKNKVFDLEMAPIVLPGKKGTKVIDTGWL
jgi:acetyl-CoA acyltransferase 2